MPNFKFSGIKIAGIASSVPSEVVKISSFASEFGDKTVNKFIETTGIKEYRKTKEFQTASDLGFASAERLIKEKCIDRLSIGAVVFVAHSTDYRRPATACVLHKRLGLSVDCVAFDIGLGCSAFVYGIQSVAALMSSSNINRALVIIGETLTKIVNPKDSSAVMMFGDAGSAILLEKADDATEILGSLKTDGLGYRAIIAPGGGARNMNASHDDMIWDDGNVRNLYNSIMNGIDVFEFSIRRIPKTIIEFLNNNSKDLDSYDILAFHQSNYLIHKRLSKKLNVSLDRMPLCLEHYGNTSAPAIPLLLCDKYGNENGEKISVLACGFGVGLSWGVLDFEIDIDDIMPVFECDEYFDEGIINSPDDMKK